MQLGCVLGKVPGAKQPCDRTGHGDAARGCLIRLGYKLAWMASLVSRLPRRIVVRSEEAGIVFGHQALIHSFIVKETRP